VLPRLEERKSTEIGGSITGCRSVSGVRGKLGSSEERARAHEYKVALSLSSPATYFSSSFCLGSGAAKETRRREVTERKREREPGVWRELGGGGRGGRRIVQGWHRDGIGTG
jgi:hypothetical protein